MSETKHTPGPWVIDGKNNGGPIIRSRADGAYIARANGMPDPLETEANAYLIAAAPELYEALRAIRDELVRQDIKFGPLIADADVALAKAEGCS